jgi:hypothetical protein
MESFFRTLTPGLLDRESYGDRNRMQRSIA